MPLTRTAATVVQKVIEDGVSLDQSLTEATEIYQGSIPALKELCFGSCRYCIFYQAVLDGLIAKPLKQRDQFISFLLVAAMYQLDHMSIPDHAVVNEAVNALAKSKQSWAKKLVNGVLRNYLRSRQPLKDSVKAEHCIVSFPDHLYQMIKADWPQQSHCIFKTSNEKPPLTLRVNRRLSTRQAYLDTLSAQNIGFQITPDSALGITLNNPVGVLDIPGFSTGQVSVQDRSAQLVADALELAPGQRVLDGCAAPGGKTGLLLESEPDLGELVAVDLPHRVKSIDENLVRLGLCAKVIADDLRNSKHWWDGHCFDRILLDVPCSGTGVIRRHPDIRHRRKKGDIRKFQQQQLDLLLACWKMLKPGGILLYVTCSILKVENDQSIEKFSKDINDYELQSLADVFGLKTEYGRQRLPGIHGGDGFYYCKLKRISV